MSETKNTADKYELSKAVSKVQYAIKSKWNTLDPEPWDKCSEILETCDHDLQYLEAVIRSMPTIKKTHKPYHEWVKLYVIKGWVNKDELKKQKGSRTGIDPETGEKVIYGKDDKGEYIARPVITDPFASVKKYPPLQDALVCQESVKAQFDGLLEAGEISPDAYEIGILSLRFLPTKKEALIIKSKVETTREAQQRRAKTMSMLRDSPDDDQYDYNYGTR